MEMRKQALEEERRRREELEKKLQEETSRRQKLIDREVKLREKQRAQVGKKNRTETEKICVHAYSSLFLHGFNYVHGDCFYYKFHPSTFVLLPAPSTSGSRRKNFPLMCLYM